MSHKRPSKEEVISDFESAMKRIISSKPLNSRVAEKLSMGKNIRTISDIAREAGHSRTLLSSKDTAFPELRSAALHITSASRKHTVTSKKHHDLRQKLRQLRHENALLASENASLTLKIEHLERQLLRASKRNAPRPIRK